MNEKFSYVIAREFYELAGELEIMTEVEYGDLKQATETLDLYRRGYFKIYKLVELDTNSKL